MIDAARTRSPRPLPVAELPEETLISHADELARQWAIALILARPADAIGAVPLEDLAREGPVLCAQALRALQSDLELECLTGRDPPSCRDAAATLQRLPMVCGATSPAALVDALEALRGVLWEALLGELREPSARLVGDTSDRLAHVCAAMLAVALDATVEPGLGRSAGRVDQASPREVGEQPGTSPGGAVIVDEHVRATPPRASERRPPPGVPARETPPAATVARAARTPEGLRPWGEPTTVGPGAHVGEIEIRDERREEGAAAWIGSIGARLEHFERDGLPFAVLLVELVEIERLRREEPPERFAQLDAGVEELLASALGRWSGTLTRERPGRYWLLAPATDRDGAARLAERLTHAVGARAGHRGAALTVAVGTAVCPEDGRHASALAAHADVGLFAARAAVGASAVPSSTVVDESA
jgi:hypothetical protein